MDRYTARMTAHGKTQRERYIHRLKQDIVNKIPDNPSYKTILLNGKETNLVINSAAQVHYKKFQSLPDEQVCLGDYITWNNQIWLVNKLNPDSEIYSSGEMVLCTIPLRWQRKDGTVVERWAYSEDFTKYDSGQVANGVITVASNQYGMTIPADEETKKLKRDMRFAVDFEDAEIPDVYLLSNRKVVLNNDLYFNRGGVMTLTLTFNSFDRNIDKQVKMPDGRLVWICGYKKTEKPDTGSPESPTTVTTAYIDGSDSINGGRRRSWRVIFTDENGNELSGNETDFLWEWDIATDFGSDNIEVLNQENNEISLKVDNEFIGETFVLSIKKSGTTVAQKTIEILGM